MKTTGISSITKGPRQSNFELLRIVAMLLVLGVHADFWSLKGGPTIHDFADNPLNAWTRTFFESATIVCVNVFILISGWFGIKPSARGFLNFIFQCFYFLLGLYIIAILCGQAQLSCRGTAYVLGLTSNWFITAYAALYILSPILNAYVEKASKRNFAILLILFFTFQTIWGWRGIASNWITDGYSCFSFIGLYLLGRYTRLYGIPYLTHCGGGIYALTILLNSLLFWVTVKIKYDPNIYAYVNPLVILGALGLLVQFSKLKIRHSKYINWIATSAFSVYLLHTNQYVAEPIYKETVRKIYNNCSGPECLILIFCFMIAVFIIAVLLDQPRKWIWKKILPLIPK